MAEKIKFTMDGEQLKQIVEVPERKFTPKEVINSLEQSRNNVNQMEDQKIKLGENLNKLEIQIKEGKEHIKRLAEFEQTMIDILHEKLLFQIKSISVECKEKALKDTEEIIAKDPSAYTEDQKKNMKYVNYQRLLAIDEKIAKKIPRSMITECIFENPVFENPFK